MIVPGGTAEQLSHTYTCVHSPPNSPPSRLPRNIEQSPLRAAQYWTHIRKHWTGQPADSLSKGGYWLGGVSLFHKCPCSSCLDFCSCDECVFKSLLLNKQSGPLASKENLQWQAAVYQLSEVKSLSRAWLFVSPRTVAYQAAPSMGFSRQEYWSGVPFPSPRGLPDSGIKPRSPAFQADTLTSEPPRKPHLSYLVP